MILPGVTRDSVLALAREHSSKSNRLTGLPEDLTVSERSVTMLEVKEASESGKLVELFGAGTSTPHLSPFFFSQPFYDRYCCCYQPSGQDWIPRPRCSYSNWRRRHGTHLETHLDRIGWTPNRYHPKRLERYYLNNNMSFKPFNFSGRFYTIYHAGFFQLLFFTLEMELIARAFASTSV